MSARARAAALLLVLLWRPAPADVTLSGEQHIGDCNDNSATACAGFTPRDPQSRTSMSSTLVKFHLSTPVTITAVRLDGVLFQDRTQLEVHIQPLGSGKVLRAGTLSADTYTFVPSVILPTAGDYSIWIDGGCSSANADGSYFYDGCSGGNDDNDFGFNSITLVSADSNTSRMFSRRRHLGDGSEGDNDYGGRYYPDDAEATSLTLNFSLDANRRLTRIEVYSLRDINATGPRATVSVEGTPVGSLTAGSSAVSPFPIDTNVLLLGGIRSLTIATAAAADRDDISWDDIVLKFADTVVGGSPGLFNAVDTGSNGVSGTLSTKIAGAAPSIDVVALDPLGTAVNSTYTGTVTVQLMDATIDGAVDAFSGCHATWSEVFGQSVSLTFGLADLGRKALPAPFFSGALRRAALKITDATSGAIACATDRFALRPDRFDVTATQGSESTPGNVPLTNTGTSGLPRHRAGLPFTLTAVARDAAGAELAGYGGMPDTLQQTTAIAPATVDGTVTVGTWAASGATRTTDDARYDEAGAFTLLLRDKTFADIDLADTSEAGRWILGTADVGRFTPDHFAFAVTQAEFAPFCTTFTYAGQSFGYALAPVATVAAMSGHATPVVTRNYTEGALYKLPAVLPQSTFTASTGTLTTVLQANPDNAVANLGNGVAQVTLDAATQLRFVRGAPVAPFEADIAITLGVLGESDGIDFDTGTPGRFGEAAAGLGVNFTGGAKTVRFGRLAIDNAHGSERLDLKVPLRAEYWDNGFQPNAADTCTALNLANFNIVTTLTTTPSLSANAGGTWDLTLTAPGTPGQATITPDLGAAGLAWLRTDSDGNGVWNEDPTAIATFGISNDRQQRIFQREVVGF